MARGKSSVHGFRVKRSGEQAVANSSGVQSLLARRAGYMAGNANAALGEGAYRSRQVQGRFARGYVVSVALGDETHRFRDADRREQILRDQL